MTMTSCPSCGKETPEKEENCIHCGASLKEAEMDPTLDFVDRLGEEDLSGTAVLVQADVEVPLVAGHGKLVGKGMAGIVKLLPPGLDGSR